jgi:NAD(P)-dependent dehydrogenase (short-subunit alcohol dehydrogenase family)
MDLELRNQVVLITGGARGIGAATVGAFAAEGARVAFVDRDEPSGTALAYRLPGSVFLHADLTDDAACARVVAEALGAFGRLDVLVNNAGVNDKVALEDSPAAFLESLRRNLIHVFAVTHYARAALVAARGVIINISSKVSVTGQGRTSGYAAAKGAVNALTREWALALAPDGIRVNTVVPAECDSDQYERWFQSQPDPEAARGRVARLVPLGKRLTHPEEVADAILWLSSARSSHITGQLLYVDGGYTHLDRAATSDHAW